MKPNAMFTTLKENKDFRRLYHRGKSYVSPVLVTYVMKNRKAGLRIGFTTSKKIAALAEAHDVLVIPHNPLGPVSTAACLQICASIPNLGIQELPGFCLNGAEDKMVKEPLRYENGCMLIPDAPGIGVELADDAEELYPAKERGSNAARRASDGAVKDW